MERTWTFEEPDPGSTIARINEKVDIISGLGDDLNEKLAQDINNHHLVGGVYEKGPRRFVSVYTRSFERMIAHIMSYPSSPDKHHTILWIFRRVRAIVNAQKCDGLIYELEPEKNGRKVPVIWSFSPSTDIVASFSRSLERVAGIRGGS